MIRRSIEKDMLNGNIFEQIMFLAIPFLGSYIIQQLYSFVDTIVLGRFVGTDALAAVGGSATQIINIVVNLIAGIASGAMVMVAQNLGKGDIEKVNNTIKTGMCLSVVMGAFLTLTCCVFSKQFLVLTKCPKETTNQSLIYMNTYFLSFVPYMIFTVGNYILRASGDTKRSLLFTIIIAVVKIGFDLLLTGAMNMGIWGCSIATFLSHLVCGIVVLYIFNNTDNLYQYSLKNFGFDTKVLKNIIKIGLPIAMQSIAFVITNLIIQIQINSYGTQTVAAFSVYNNVDNFYWSFSNAIGAAIITIAGQNYGNKNIKRIKEIIRKGIVIHLVGSIVIGVVCYVFGMKVISLYTTDEIVKDIANRMLTICASSYWIYTLVEIISGTIKGCGDSTNSMIIALIGICVIRIAMLMIFKYTNPEKILYCYPVSWAITSIFYLIYYISNSKYRLTKSNQHLRR